MTKIKNERFKCALVTGACGGIGKALCTILLENNIPLIISGRNAKVLQALKNSLPVNKNIISIPCDLNNKKDRSHLLKAIEDHKPDLVINNAGLGLYGHPLDFKIEKQIEILEINILALTEITLHTAKVLKDQKQQGVILNISSIVAFIPFFPGFNLYSASKNYILNFSKTLDYEMSPFDIRILCSCPGQIDTPFHEKATHKKKRKKNPKYLHQKWLITSSNK